MIIRYEYYKDRIYHIIANKRLRLSNEVSSNNKFLCCIKMNNTFK